MVIRRKHGNSSILTHNKTHVNPPPDLDADTVNTFFSSIGKDTAASIATNGNDFPWKGPTSSKQFQFQMIGCEYVHKLLVKLGKNSRNDVLGFDSKLLYFSADVIAPILTKLFNASLTTSIIPSNWKLASVAPVYQGEDDKFKKHNNIPISVIGYIPKIFCG
jgi:hypothetical protein